MSKLGQESGFQSSFELTGYITSIGIPHERGEKACFKALSSVQVI